MDLSRINPRIRLNDLTERFRRIEREIQEVRASLTENADAISGLTALVHSAAAAASVRASIPRPPYRVLFLVHHLGAWPGMHAIVQAMLDSDDFRPTVATIPHKYPGDEGFRGEEALHERLAADGIEHIRFNFSDSLRALPIIRAIDPDLVLRQSQWDNDVPTAFRTNALNFLRQGLVPYEPMNPIVNPPVSDRQNTAVDEELHTAGWVVFATNELMLDMSVREGHRLGQNVDVVGHAKAHELRTAKPFWPFGNDHIRPRIVWSAHHSVGSDWTQFGTFGMAHGPMLEFAKTHQEVEFVFLAHPALEPRIHTPQSPVSPAQYSAFLRNWSALPNAEVCNGAEYMNIVAASDCVVTDGVSMLIEPQVMTKPIVFLERAGHAPFNDIGEIAVAGVHRVSDVAEAQRLALSLASGESDPLEDRQRTNTDLLFPSWNVGEKVLAALRARFTAEVR
ncbi:hypothetical protein HII28_14470 [Planctomonas sp. JC2975]|uniref:hypothetical protein n=1 Tax=Planctomonas sp. JC2975 TaxID=2729626 RepID=UPI00147421D7|nr:hypothetical protein [Planctomonas sp. JC2975]NNC13077.1 hypothetical protein [Planctomonas sp. JC2975]